MGERVVVGIDLGTTYSLVSVLRDDVPIVLPNALGEHLTPSAVSVDEQGVWLVGAAARARAVTHPLSTVLAFKRDMGTDRTYRLGGTTKSPVELSAMVLAELKRDAEAALGIPITEAVITVPAYFGDRQRQATRDAAEIAGLRADRIVNEPTAAALAYGLHRRDRDLRVCVLDLGGGTFDVTILSIADGIIEIHASAGDARLGGEDFTDAIVTWALEAITQRHGAAPRPDTREHARVREAAEHAKKILSREPTAGLALPGLALGRATVDVTLALDREQALRLWKPLLDRLRAPITRALRDASLLPSAIDEVLLVGGATRMRPVVELASSVFGKLPSHQLPPDEAVALGAAVQAALEQGHSAVEDVVVTDVAPFTLGVESSEISGNAVVGGLFVPVLERGTTIPASRVKRFFTLHPEQTQLNVRVFQGEHSLVRDNHFLGEYLLKGLPTRRAETTAVDVRLTYDLNGILEVEMSVVGSSRTEQLVIEQRPGKLGRAAVDEARRAMASLKIHPRSTLPNRTALERAEALFVQLTGPERDTLGVVLGHFRATLESQDPAVIEPARKELAALTAALARRE
ncbi:MAG: Hsp70 family protein [Sandaracinaceae bacterium]|nr:Hsp70 family protein [Sandaracinaceae bacterium]